MQFPMAAPRLRWRGGRTTGKAPNAMKNNELNEVFAAAKVLHYWRKRCKPWQGRLTLALLPSEVELLRGLILAWLHSAQRHYKDEPKGQRPNHMVMAIVELDYLIEARQHSYKTVRIVLNQHLAQALIAIIEAIDVDQLHDAPQAQQLVRKLATLIHKKYVL